MMKYLSYVVRNIGISILIVVVFTQNSFSYIDPGTWNYIFQMLIAGFIGAMFALRIFWGKLKAFVLNLFTKSN